MDPRLLGLCGWDLCVSRRVLGPHVGFYGGVNYGFGYTGAGFARGAWQGNRYAYNRAVTDVNVTDVHNTYNTTVIKMSR
ncbi:MAG: hypothetical protein WDM77_11345 [Steroidobacteraceae bacterium]